MSDVAVAEQELKAEEKTLPVGIPASVVAIAGLCEPSDELLRHSIDCIRVTIANGEYEVAATDGRRLAIVRGEYADASVELAVTIHPKFIIAAIETCGGNVRKIKRLNDMLLLFSLIDGKCHVQACRRLALGAVIVCEPNEVRFPQYRDVVPVSEVQLSVFFSAKLLSECVTKCAEFSEFTEHGGVQLHFRGNSDVPVVIEPVQNPDDRRFKEVKFLLMPTVEE